MDTLAPDSQALAAFLQCLDRATGSGSDAERCARVQAALQQTAAAGRKWLPARFLRPSSAGYARRLLHLDPAGRYCVLIMVWAPGQSSALHDHAGSWGVECVHSGQLRVASYRRLPDLDAHRGLCDFRLEQVAVQKPGDTEVLLPRADYHRVENPGPELAVTIHVYGRNLAACNQFLPRPAGGWQRVRRPLTNSQD